MYGNVTDADTYWSARLNGTYWLLQSVTIKTQALQSATDAINRLNLLGTADPTNTSGNHYPLSDNCDAPTIPLGVIPDGIITATYELAYCLIATPVLPGASLASKANVKRSKVGVTETEFFGNVSPWEAAGIPCQMVWLLLDPFMGDPSELTLERVS